MMGLIYGQSATQSSGINKDFFAVEELCGVYHCRLLQRLKPLMDTRPPSMPGTLRRGRWIPSVHVVELNRQHDHIRGPLPILHAAQLYRLWQLETAARLLLIALYDWTPDSEQTAERAGLYGVHLFKTRAAAWREVCSDYNIAPDAFNALLPGNDILEMTARVAADIETAPGDFAEDVRNLNGAGAQPVTLESELAAFRALIAEHTL